MAAHVPFLRLSIMGQVQQPAPPPPDGWQRASHAAAGTIAQPNLLKGAAIGVGLAVGLAALSKVMTSRERS